MSIISAENVAVRFAGMSVLRDVAFAAGAGEIVGLIGPNGAGKTTLLRVLAGLLRPEAGRVWLRGRPLSAIGRQERGRLIGYLPQDGETHWAVTVETLVSLGRLPHLGPWRAPQQADRAAVARAMGLCDVTHLAHRPASRLSGGERARVLLARLLAGEPAVILADEPVAGLDPAHQLDVMELLRARAAAGTSVTVVMHDLSLAARYCDRLVLLVDGRVSVSGPATEVLSPPNLARCYGIQAHQGRIGGVPYVLPVRRTSRDGQDASH